MSHEARNLIIIFITYFFTSRDSIVFHLSVICTRWFREKEDIVYENKWVSLFSSLSRAFRFLRFASFDRFASMP